MTSFRLELPALHTLSIGSQYLTEETSLSCFSRCKNLYLSRLGSLSSIVLGHRTFKNLSSMTLCRRKAFVNIEDCSSLREVKLIHALKSCKSIYVHCICAFLIVM